MSSVKVTYLLLALGVCAVAVHNLLYGIWQREDAVSFAFALCFLFAFAIFTIYNTVSFLKRRQPADLWKLGWIGFLGLLGLFPRLNYAFLAFFAFFGFLAARRGRLHLNKLHIRGWKG